MTQASPHEVMRWAEVDAGAISANAAAIRSWLEPSVQLMAMVKSDGYGHGIVTAARAALEGGAAWLGVYTPDEALQLRAADVDAPLLVCGCSPPSTMPALVEAGVDVSVISVQDVAALAASGRTRPAQCHVKVDTGLARLGVRPADIPELARALDAASGSLQVRGIFTHFADAAADDVFTDTQRAALMQAVAGLRDVAPSALVHAAGSAAIIRRPDTHFDLVRAGIALYGYAPAGTEPPAPLLHAMAVCARIVQVKSVPDGTTVGYGRTWRAKGERRIATAAIGYGQGLARSLSNRGAMLVRGALAPIAGTVSMDQVTLDVSEIAHVRAGDIARLFGRDGEVVQGADEVAGVTGTIAYEVLCATGRVLPRLGPAAVPRGASPAALP